MEADKKIELVLREPTEELITARELRDLLETKEHPKHYIGYEISGLLHVGSLFIAGYKIRDLLEAGFECTIFLADWHSVLNNKLGGDLERIKKGAKYFEEGFRAFLGKNKRLKFVLGSDLYHNNDNYWANVMKIAKATTLSRTKRCLTIMGRKETDSLDLAQFIYPPMQAADILEMELDVVHSGIDQRKIHMLLRDISKKLGVPKPIALHHHLLSGLIEPVRLGLDEDPARDLKISSKMSKSKPGNCISIHDSEEEIREKIKNAWCPISRDNPILEIAKYILFRESNTFTIQRPEKFGGEVEFENYTELERAYLNKEIHPLDLKESVAFELNKLIAPLRKRFEGKEELLSFYETDRNNRAR